MGSIHLLLGRSRFRRRRAVPSMQLSGVDPYGNPTFLYVTDTHRKKAVVEQEFVAFRKDRPVFSPRVRVLSELFDELSARHGSGGALLPDRVCALVAQRIVAGGGGWLASLGSPAVVGEALATLHGRLAEAGARRVGAWAGSAASGVPHLAELDRALVELERRLAAIPGFTTRPRALVELTRLLEQPPSSLVEWLRATHSVVIDDLLALSPIRTALLVALCRAWESVGTHVVVSFESGRDLGGREAGLFFGYDDTSDVAFALKPFAASRALRHALFEALVGEGGQADVLLAGRDRIDVIDPGSPLGDPEPPDLLDRAFSERPLEVSTPGEARALLGPRIRFVACVDPAQEIARIAREVKDALLAGVDPRDCVVALPDLAESGATVRAVFDDHGVPFTLTAGARLAHAPVANVTRRVAALAREGFPVTGLLAVLGTDLVAGTDPEAVARLARWCRAAGVRQGLPSTWEAPLRRWLDGRGRAEAKAHGEGLTEWLAALDAVCAPLLPLALDATPAEFRDRLLGALDALGVPARVAMGPDPQIAAEGIRAWGAVLDAVSALAADLAVAHPGTWSAEDLGLALDRALQDGSWNPETRGGARVQIVGPLELRGLTPRYTWLGGLHRAAFPRSAGPGFLLPPALAWRLQPIDPLAEARHLVTSLLRNALDATPEQMASLVVSWPSTVGGRLVPPSPVIAELVSLPTRLGPTLGELVVERPTVGAPSSRSEALRAAASDPAAWAPLLGGVQAAQVARQRAVAAARHAPSFTEHDGVLTEPVDAPTRLGVTAMETYLKCPARFGYQRLLGLSAAGEWDPELDPLDRGSALHRILDVFLRERAHRSLRGEADRDAAAAHLAAVADTVLEASRGTADPAWFEQQRRTWTRGLRPGDAGAGLLRVWLDQEIDDPSPLTPVETEVATAPLALGPVTLTGKIDRIDRVDGGGVVVSDYKTGQVPSATLVARGLALQPVAYAEAAARRFDGEAVAMAYYQVRRPDEVGRQTWCGSDAVVQQVTGRRPVLSLDAPQRAALLAHAARAAERMHAGVFHPTLASAEDAGCRTCDFRRVCRVRPERQVTGDWQRPVEAAP